MASTQSAVLSSDGAARHCTVLPDRGLEWCVVDVASHRKLERVLSRYPLGKLKATQRPEHGFVNDNWIIDTTDGRFFLKHRHPTLSEPAFVLAQHALTTWLRSGGFPAPQLKRTNVGKSLCILDNECYEIQEFIPGTHCDRDREGHLGEAASTLARYHTAVRSLAPSELCTHHLLYSPLRVADSLSQLVRIWRLTADAELTDPVKRIQAQVRDLARRFAEHGTLPGLVIHGDYYADNLLFDSDRIVGVVDYDKARWQARVVELAEALIHFASPQPGQLQHLVYPGFPLWSLLFPFLEAYCRIVPLLDAEADALPNYVQCIWMQMSLLRLQEEAKRPSGAHEALEEVLALGHWVQVHRSDLADACRSASRPSGADRPRKSRLSQERTKPPTGDEEHT
jgi:homoserine kinase type II